MYLHQWNVGPGYGYSYGVENFGGAAPGWLLALMAIAAPVVLFIVLWSLFWKGLSLWHSARRGQYWWFVILLVLNTVGILDIIYLFFVARLKITDLFSLRSHEHDAHH